MPLYVRNMIMFETERKKYAQNNDDTVHGYIIFLIMLAVRYLIFLNYVI